MLSDQNARNTLGWVTGLRRRGATYSAFPQTPNTSHKQELVRSPHKPWPLTLDTPQPKPTRQVYRSHSYTLLIIGSQVLQPSNLSTCITTTSDAAANANTNSAASSRVGTIMYSKSAPVILGTTCFSPSLMDLIKSVFEDDDAEDEDEKTGLVAFASRLHLRSLSAGGKESKEKTALRKEKAFRHSTSEALKGVFGKK